MLLCFSFFKSVRGLFFFVNHFILFITVLICIMLINANTKIAALIRQNPEALEAIVSISPKFTKLRNPLLRKVIAGRTSIAMASKIGGCEIQDFFNKLKPIGFEIDTATKAVETEIKKSPLPDFMKQVQPGEMNELDVRPLIDGGKDPLNTIIQRVKSLQPGMVLKIINSFEPTPLIHLLGKQGFISYTETISPDMVNTYFYKQSQNATELPNEVKKNEEDWDTILKQFENMLVTVDVRELEMPLPMHTILEALASLPAEKALFVYHKRIPVFLLPELEQQGFSYRIKEISDGEVQLLIFKK